MNRKKVKLTGKEKSELFGEGVVTVVLLLLLNLSILILINLAILNNQDLINGIWIIKQSISFGEGFHIYSWQNIFVGFMAITDLIVLYWRLIRRYHQMQMRHVISELHYIAEGNFDHRINFYVKTDLQKVIDSINSLVDSTVAAMQEERQIEQSKDDLVTNVSHDIRTPLTSIIGYLGLLRTGTVKSEEDAKKYIDIAYLKANQMKSLADDLYEYTTVRQSQTTMSMSELHVNSMLEQVAASFELEAEKKNIQLNVETTPADITMEADAEKMGRVFNNLVSNALKYGNGATNINLIATRKDVDKIVIRVENDGEPIPNDALTKIFERFYRVETSRSVETGGTGLGLAITQSIIELHHGKISVTSDEALTAFIIELPLKQEERED
ncbi:two-component system histidine kinase [Amylolactobacillus amylotrophicus DSM 20534]|uniref:Two-component sensor histidine kinase n=3 Tax=Amylolactobacillus TaxID=2767876 RepID=A0A1L6XCF0_9LACO|nr:MULTISPECIES: HAMP domain-containing sensor histidine kinase [Amylolactobacillus]APT18655.1 two-component sensor histidine kinase [Amylolactobacillus amylophilus DSM 20533 = JCM 1125]KRK37782.1 two-component system histidine kinase [Amylolactobacillus amylotrophicus DSM 20534]KRM41570.1 two-component system histidine kinase [Amylolactobacillus amylophilus DSM 20533 = JCM 1125]GED80800.1 two-component sensor histidine kinase [Amylolactobacillus amylophilus]